MRGLKLINLEARKKALVASFTDAWIETTSPTPVEDEGNESHLLQMRGLKRFMPMMFPIQTSRIFYRCVD